MTLKEIRSLILFSLVVCIFHCVWESNACIHVEHALAHIGPASRSLQEGRRFAYKYLGSRVPYYDNSYACFQPSLVICGDISSNPGPLPPASSTHDEETFYHYDSSDLHRYRGHIVSGQNKHYMRLHYDVWDRIHHLGIARKRKTHRGSKGHGRKARSVHDHLGVPHHVFEVRIAGRQPSSCTNVFKAIPGLTGSYSGPHPSKSCCQVCSLECEIAESKR